jgi:hypothetical protein
VYAPRPGRIMPFALTLLGLSTLLVGGWWDKARSFGKAPEENRVGQPPSRTWSQ